MITWKIKAALKNVALIKKYFKKVKENYKKNTTLKMVISTDSERLHIGTVCIWHCEHAHFCKDIFIHHITYADFYSWSWGANSTAL